ncbi:hypothetical protein N7489_006277 [Penicillium chrysogenum]|uniref:Uncharacterized protein n=1 Tax=Penicillium chrysogenum TaxID=5076 RepID=A0ABQ8W4K6_PENCH|nr:uncharacterized protein N7489_006277 [Penicillium chrysogenum]XP_061070780.1 uncharacterized protein N7525_000397 [Penicillium rubens]KAJ5236186.1 hypothetical protein N7489_006277 [Penicillium chrysogenum]KAJ5255090.1 hypothetical protein N7505_010241 [Penicillium chrysogenum]KAJ5842656.1 hypothetical protein N7525_000397 [Penicillium rubens]KAJ5846771.1 hypothetical protein N7534_010440 [Penicillium rubens]KAJ6153113.1 hypothetical protein N7497_007432 [Penicillium chrysogenum]
MKNISLAALSAGCRRLFMAFYSDYPPQVEQHVCCVMAVPDFCVHASAVTFRLKSKAWEYKVRSP